MNVCAGCHQDIDDDERCCEICELIIPAITGQGSNFVTEPEMVQSVREQLGDNGSNLAQIWRAIASLEGNEGDWALGASKPDYRSWIIKSPRDWKISPDRMDSFYRNKASVPSIEELRDLQRGGCLPDGSYLTWNGGSFYLDGMKIRVPYRGLSKIIERSKGRTDIDYRKLLLSIDLALRDYPTVRRYRGELNTNSVIHPVHSLFRKIRSHDPSDDETFRRIIHQNDVARKAFFHRTTWFLRWKEMEKYGTRILNMPDNQFVVPRTLMLSNGRLQLRVRRNAGWRRISLANDPDLWSRVVTWCLSPPGNYDLKRLHCIQQHAFVDEGKPLICGDELRGIEFLRKIIEGNERAKVDRYEKCIEVEGSSGLNYEVKLSRNPHGARFQVFPLEGRDNPSHGFRFVFRNTAICIVELPELRNLVFGDAIGTIVMALLDDITSQRHIHTLKLHVEYHMNKERNLNLEAVNEARELRGRLRNNEIQRREDRYTDLFPRLWGVLLRRPLGERMTFRAMQRGRPNVSFDGCATQFETTSRADRQALYEMLESSGWMRDAQEEMVRPRGLGMVFIRVGTGPRDLSEAVDRFCDVMEERMVLPGGVRINEGPLSEYFERENPGITELLPGTDCIIR